MAIQPKLNYPTFREMDDKVVVALKLLDTALASILKTIVISHKEFMADTLISIVQDLDNYSGGIRLITKSRKKEVSKLAILELIARVDKPDAFMRYMSTLGLSRRARHTILATFVDVLSKHYLQFLSLYKDPTSTYTTVIPIIHSYNNVRKQIIDITVRYLSKTVLSKYSGWVLKRNIASSLDRVVYEEDVQNSMFYIKSAIDLFNTNMHKSFFSYASWWIRYGIKVSEFSMQKADDPIFQEYEEKMDIEVEVGGNISIEDEISDNETLDLTDGSTQEYQLISELFKCSLPLSIELRILTLLTKK